MSNLKSPSWLSDFRKFIMRGNVLDLAVGVVIGAAFTTIVNSAVKDMLTPVIGALTGGIDFSNIFLTIKGPVKATLAEAQKAGAVTVNIGVFLNAVIQFLIVAFFVFWLTRIIGKLYRHENEAKNEAAAEPPKPSREEILLTEIRDLLASRSS